MSTILNYFRLGQEAESFAAVKESISRGVEFRGTNLWILVFAIFIASLGLNVNSTAVIIGAMLISPLMGPIMGIGLALAINDFDLLKKALANFGVATLISLITSTVYFLLTPLNEAHSEILARTSPNIYDVLIALFGGLAGMLANASKLKGNVITGVAIATALMPPLCTAGYGLATFQLSFMLGAFYLFFINTVFIALATYITAKAMNFPVQHLADNQAQRKARLFIWLVTVLTFLPSVYFGIDSVRKARFVVAANRFISKEVHFQNDFLLGQQIDADKRMIQLTFGGDPLPDSAVESLKRRLPDYDLVNTGIDIRMGFANSADERYNALQHTLAGVFEERDLRFMALRKRVDSLVGTDTTHAQLFRELKSFLPAVEGLGLQSMPVVSDSGSYTKWMAEVLSKRPLSQAEKQQAQSWLKARIGKADVRVSFLAGRQSPASRQAVP